MNPQKIAHCQSNHGTSLSDAGVSWGFQIFFTVDGLEKKIALRAVAEPLDFVVVCIRLSLRSRQISYIAMICGEYHRICGEYQIGLMGILDRISMD